ncbi:MAG: radical SAM family heme chaperone HemW [Flavobacteriales bacterium]
MAGIYIHIPFCRKACHYCDFHFSTSLKTKEKVLSAIVTELCTRTSEIKGQAVETIYFGGGTPSLLSYDELHSILSALQREYEIIQHPEVTLEANPEDITPEALNHWKNLGFNRLSIGIQSFNEEILTWMNRAHDAKQALECVPLAQDAGFGNISIDLIYGVPHRTSVQWKEEVTKALALNTTHISAYCLTIEPQTAFGARAQKGEVLSSPNAQSADEYAALIALGRKHEMLPYEISNFSKPGFISQHNTNYWRGQSYLGIGPGAHSYVNGKRSWNVSHNVKYAKGIHDLDSISESEVLSIKDQYNEYIMTGLRQYKGVELEYIQHAFSCDLLSMFSGVIDSYSSSGHLTHTDGHLKLTEKGILLADRIASDLFQTND